jgi:hypothetical protein
MAVDFSAPFSSNDGMNRPTNDDVDVVVGHDGAEAFGDIRTS